MKHTALPWKVEPYLTPERDDDPLGVYVVHPASKQLEDQYISCSEYFENEEREQAALDKVHAENVANAEYIVRACNSHEELVEALKESLAWMNCEPMIQGEDSIKERAELAITHAEGNQEGANES